MSHQNVELVRSLQPSRDADLAAMFRDEAAAAAVIERLTPFFHEDVEIVAPDVVGDRAGYRGLDGMRAGWLQWLEPWESYRVEVEDVIDAGDDAVVLVRDFGRRAGMTVEASVIGGAVWTVRDGRVARVAFFLRRAEALKAVGLDE